MTLEDVVKKYGMNDYLDLNTDISICYLRLKITMMGL